MAATQKANRTAPEEMKEERRLEERLCTWLSAQRASLPYFLPHRCLRDVQKRERKRAKPGGVPGRPQEKTDKRYSFSLKGES